MPARSGWGLTPRQSVEFECARRGEPQVVAGCVALLLGQDADDDLLRALGGPNAEMVLDDGPEQRNQYWRRVWGARGLLYAWADHASGAVVAALGDEHWRVREMAAKVVARRKLGDAVEAVAALRADPVPRVRAAAERVTVILTAAGS
ncbi:MAG: HEAT repeat domain-containing protein [Streptosporangiaceae bacterium]